MRARSIQIADILEVVADAVPDRVALVAGDIEHTYASLDDRATRLANHLRESGIGAGDHVGIHAANCAEWIEAYYACFKLSATPININYRYREAELRHLYGGSDCVGVVVAPEFAEAVVAVEDAFSEMRVRLVVGEEFESAIASGSPDRDFAPRSGDDHYIVYTGGTTGLPKGVVWRNEDLFFGALNSYRQGAPLDAVEQLAEEAAANQPSTLLSVAPMMHGGTQWSMGNSHAVGGKFALYTEPSFDADAVLGLASRVGANVLSLVGDAMGKPVADRLLDPDGHPYDLSSVFAVANGAAPISPAVRTLLGQAFPHSILTDGYGSSEAGTTGMRVGAEDHSSPRFQTGPGITVLTEEMLPAGDGEVGLLARSGPIPLGYYNDPEATATTFPVVDGTRWVVPGDYARREEDGTISVLGRGSGSINTGGEKVFPEEVASALMGHADIDDAVVVGTPHERWGSQVTALVRSPRNDLSLDEVRDYCKGLLADYKAPGRIFVIDAVPHTPVGKVDYKASLDLAMELLSSQPDA